MSTDAVSPLRQRMIEDMNARKLCAGTQRGHISSCKRFAAFVKQSPDTATLEDIRRFQLHLAETGASICKRSRFMTGLRFLVPRDAAPIGPCGRDLSPPRTSEDSARDEYG
jgi:integrase/recombinase XerD